MKKLIQCIAMVCVLTLSYGVMANTRLSGSKTFEAWQLTNVNLSAANESKTLNIARFNHGTVQLVWDTVVGSATIEIQSSVNGVSWDSVYGTLMETVKPNGSESFILNPLPGRYLKVKVTSPATSGMLKVYSILKR